MREFSKQKVASLEHLCGYLVCAKSPSCGMERVKVYTEHEARKSGVGIFTQQLMAHMPWLPVEEDGRLYDSELRENLLSVFTRYTSLTSFGKRFNPWCVSGLPQPL